jgi:hypothetical protein
MNHDPLCGWSLNEDCEGRQPHKEMPSNTNGFRWRICDRCGYECKCGLIAKVRQDERSRHQGQSVMLAADADAAIAAATADMLANCIAGIELWPAAALRQRTQLDGTKEPLRFLIDKADVLEVLRRLQEQP